jgi:CubicO group peptidase (beta-lactamase class C family)
MLFRIIFLLFFSVTSWAQSEWPTHEWRTSTPEKQGLDSNKLAEAVEFVLRENVRAHSLLVIRNGFVVADVYFFPYTSNTRHDVASVTKSITSTLIGMAIDKGLIKDVSQPVLGLFQERKAANLDDRKKAMTIADLLTMQSGLQCVNSPTEVTLFQMLGSPDWIQFMLDLPMTDPPGARFAYNSGAVHLLSAVIRKTSGMKAQEFGRRFLFEPLGISDVLWPTDPRGEDNHGWGDLQLRPHDMAKIGYLLLKNGQWEGKPILSADWVRAATQKRVTLGNGESYGYLWWMPAQPPGLIEAHGRGGQRIIIWPEKNAVIVFTGGGFQPGRIGSILIEAFKSNQPLADNPAGVARLGASIKRAAQPPAASMGEAVPWPETAVAVSGKRFILEPNPYSVQALILTFKDRKEAVLDLEMGPEFADRPRLEFLVGLEGVPHLAPGRFGLPAAAQGAWKSPDTFVLELDEVANINHFVMELTFEDGRLSGTLAETTGLGSTPIRGKVG